MTAIITDMKQLFDGMQVLVDGIPAIYKGGKFINPRAPLTKEAGYMSLMPAAILRETRVLFWGKSGNLISSFANVVWGGEPMRRVSNARFFYMKSAVRASLPKDERDLSSREVHVYEAVADRRVEINDDPATYVDYDSWMRELGSIYERS